MGKVKALYEYAAREENELPFAEDELLTLLSRLDSDWWLVRNDAGQCGLIPSNYVEEEGGEQGQPPEQSEAMARSASEGNIFDTASRTSSSPVSLSSKRAGQTLEEMFPGGVGERRRKWSGELQLEGESKIKGKLHWLPDIGQLVFTSKESGLVTFCQDLTALRTYDRKRGELVCRGATVRLTLAKGDGKELERLISEVAPILPGPINIITRDSEDPREESVEHEHEHEHENGYASEHEQPTNEHEAPVPHQGDKETGSAPGPGQRIYAQFDYEAQEDDELSLSVGQSLVVLEGEAGDDWWLVQDAADPSKAGLVPQTYLGEGMSATEEGEFEDQGTAAIESATVAAIETSEQQQMEAGNEASEEDNLALAAPSLNELLAKSQRSLEMVRQIEVVAGAQRGLASPPSPPLPATTERPGSSSGAIPPAPPLPPRTEALILREGMEKEKGGQAKRKEEEGLKGPEHAQSAAALTLPPPPAPLATRPPPPAPPLPARIEELTETNDSAINNKSHRPPPPVPSPEGSSLGTGELGRPSLGSGEINLRPVPAPATCPKEQLAVSPPTVAKGDRSNNTTATATDGKGKSKNPWASITLKRADSSSASSRGPRSSTAATTGSLAKSNMDMSGLGKVLPSRPAKVESTSNKPNPADTRLWKDRTGQFQTEAAFVSYGASTGVVLHKLNGNKVKVSLALLSERDVEYVCRRCGLNVASVKADIAAATRDVPTPLSQAASSDYAGQPLTMSGGGGTAEAFAVRNGFNWLLFLTHDCRLDERAARGIAARLVQTGSQEAWLDSLTKDRLKERLPDLSDSEALLFMQGVTKRRLQRLERLGQEKILQSISGAGLPPSSASPLGTRDGSGGPANLSSALTATPARLSAGLPPPLQPIKSPPPSAITGSGRSVSLSSASAPSPMHAMGRVPPPPAAPPRRSLKDVPVLQPASNSLSSVRITPQPLYREFSSSSLLPLANGQLAQQQTTTQYMFRASSGSASGVRGDGNMAGDTNGMISAGSPPSQPQSHGVESMGMMMGGARPTSSAGGEPSPLGGHQQWSAGSVGGTIGGAPYLAGQYQYQYQYPPPPSTSLPPPLEAGGAHHPSGPTMGRPSLALSQHQSSAPQQPAISGHPIAAPSFGSQPHGGWGSSLSQMSSQPHPQSRSGSFQGNQGPLSHPIVSASGMMGTPWKSVGPAMMGPNHQQQQQIASAPGDKYAIFKAVDPRSPSLLNGNPSQFTRPALHPNNGGAMDASGGNFSHQDYRPPCQGGGT